MANLAARIWRRYTSPGLVRAEFSARRADRLLGMARIRRWSRWAAPVELAAPGWEFGFDGGGPSPETAPAPPVVPGAAWSAPVTAEAASVPSPAPASVPVAGNVDARPSQSMPSHPLPAARSLDTILAPARVSRARALPLGAPAVLPADAPLSDFRAPVVHRKQAFPAAKAFPAAVTESVARPSDTPPPAPSAGSAAAEPAPSNVVGQAVWPALGRRNRLPHDTPSKVGWGGSPSRGRPPAGQPGRGPGAGHGPAPPNQDFSAPLLGGRPKTAPLRSRLSADDLPAATAAGTAHVFRSVKEDGGDPDPFPAALPLVAPPAAEAPATVRRTPAKPAPAPEAAAEPTAVRGEPDIDRLADRVYEILARRLASERARRGL